MKNRVAVDVYSWITAAKNHPSVPIEGIYRHAKSLALKFRPVVILSQGEVTDYYERYQEAMLKISSELGKPISVFISIEGFCSRYDVLVSIGLDSACPRLNELKGKVLRVAVLHDIMAYRGFFGAGNIETFKRGNENNDLLLPVSDYARQSYLNLEKEGLNVIKSFVPYGCFHTYESLPKAVKSSERESWSVSVSTVYPRKRICATAEFARSFLPFAEHKHIGRYVRSENDKRLKLLASTGEVHLTGFLLDDAREDIVRYSQAYLNFSEEEGFSMPPMEAILLGVPLLFLSDIPVHREIYGKVANFQNPSEKVDWASVKIVTDDERTAFFEAWTFDRVIQPFLDHLSTCSAQSNHET